MTITTDYRVHSASMIEAPTLALVDGEPMHAKVATFEVELVSLDPRHGTVTQRFRGTSAEEAQAMFHPGDIITASWSAKPTVAIPKTPK